MIKELTISNFRGIHELRLSGLKRVNLITGENNSGKTSILEAIAAGASPSLVSLLPGLFRSNSGSVAKRYFRWLLRDLASVAEVMIGGGDRSIDLKMFAEGRGNRRSGSAVSHTYGGIEFAHEVQGSPYAARAVSVQHRSPDAMVPNFADTVRSPENEARLERLLGRIDPRIRSARLDLIDKEQVISLDVGLSERVPLSQLGQGIYRVVSMLSDLMGSKPDLFLIDEIENGIHYTTLPVVWNGLAEIAEALDIQIFATTHSKECVEAAFEVFSGRAPSPIDMELSVIQMMFVKGAVTGRVLDGEHLEGAVKVDIEIR